MSDKQRPLRVLLAALQQSPEVTGVVIRVGAVAFTLDGGEIWSLSLTRLNPPPASD